MDERWIWAGVALAAGFGIGAVAAAFIRRLLDREGHRPAVREMAGPLGVFVFWLLVATGIVVAVAVSSPDRLETIPDDLLHFLPNVAVAGLLLIGGYALAVTLATTVGHSMARVSGRSSRGIEQSIKWAVIVGAVIVASTQFGVDTTVVNILIGGVVLGISGALAGLSIVGGRRTAEHVAAGRALAHVVKVGDSVELGAASGVVAELLPVHLILDTDGGRLALTYGSIADVPLLVTSSVGDESSRSATA